MDTRHPHLQSAYEEKRLVFFVSNRNEWAPILLGVLGKQWILKVAGKAKEWRLLLQGR